MVSWFYVQGHPKAQPAVVLILKHLRKQGHSLKSNLTDWEKPGIDPVTPGLQDICLSKSPRRLHMFWLRNKKINFLYTLLNRPVEN